MVRYGGQAPAPVAQPVTVPRVSAKPRPEPAVNKPSTLKPKPTVSRQYDPVSEHLIQTPRWVDFLQAKARGYRGGFSGFIEENPAHHGPAVRIDYRRTIFGSTLGTLELATVGGVETALFSRRGLPPLVSNDIFRSRTGSIRVRFPRMTARISGNGHRLNLETGGRTRSAKIDEVKSISENKPPNQRQTVVAHGWVRRTYTGSAGAAKHVKITVEVVRGGEGRFGIRLTDIPNEELAQAIPKESIFWFDKEGGRIKATARAGEKRAPAGHDLDLFAAASVSLNAWVVRDHPVEGLWINLEILEGTTSAIFGPSISSRLSLDAIIPRDDLPLGLAKQEFCNGPTGDKIQSMVKFGRSRDRQNYPFRWALEGEDHDWSGFLDRLSR